jgi:hypothetical protein
MKNRLVGLDGKPMGAPDPQQGPGVVAGRVQVRPSRKDGPDPEPRDYLLEAEFILPDGESWVRSAAIIQELYLRLHSAITLRQPVVKVRVFVDKAFGAVAAPYVEKLVGKDAQLWRTFTGPGEPQGDDPAPPQGDATPGPSGAP